MRSKMQDDEIKSRGRYKLGLAETVLKSGTIDYTNMRIIHNAMLHKIWSQSTFWVLKIVGH